MCRVDRCFAATWQPRGFHIVSAFTATRPERASAKGPAEVASHFSAMSILNREGELNLSRIKAGEICDFCPGLF